MLPFGVTIPATVPQGSEIPEGIINNPVYRVVIPIKLEFGASVGFIHKESLTMYGHTIVKLTSD